MSGTELLKIHPSMFRNRPILFIIALVTVPVYGIGLLIFLGWWISVLGETLIVTNKRTIYRRGIVSKYTNEVLHSNIRAVEVGQSAIQRILGVGNIGISSAGQADIEIEISGIRDPQSVANLIDRQRKI